MSKKKKKKLDCISLKKQGSELIYRKIKNMSRKEELAYWEEKENELRKLSKNKYRRVA